MTKLSAIALGLCISLMACGGTASRTAHSANPVPTVDKTVVNHIVYMLQENESFDRYFGQLNAYRQSQGLTADVDVTPANASNLSYDGTQTITPFHMLSMCVEALTPFWNQSHYDYNRKTPTSGTPLMNGFVF